jgi:hypothetical protein
MPTLLRKHVQKLVSDFGSLRAAAFSLALAEQPDEEALTESLDRWSPERGVRRALLNVPGSDAGAVERRVRLISSRTNQLRAILAEAIRDPRVLLHRMAFEMIARELPALRCVGCGAIDAQLVAVRRAEDPSGCEVRGVVCHSCMLAQMHHPLIYNGPEAGGSANALLSP